MKAVLTFPFFLLLCIVPVFGQDDWNDYISGFGNFMTKADSLKDRAELIFYETDTVKMGEMIPQKFARKYIPFANSKRKYYYGYRLDAGEYTYAIVFRKETGKKTIGSLVFYKNGTAGYATDISMNCKGHKSLIFRMPLDNLYSIVVNDSVQVGDTIYNFNQIYETLFLDGGLDCLRMVFFNGKDTSGSSPDIDSLLKQFPSEWEDLQEKYELRALDVTSNDFLKANGEIKNFICGPIGDESKRINKVVSLLKHGHVDYRNIQLAWVFGDYLGRQAKENPEKLATAIRELSEEEQENLWEFLSSMYILNKPLYDETLGAFRESWMSGCP